MSKLTEKMEDLVLLSTSSQSYLGKYEKYTDASGYKIFDAIIIPDNEKDIKNIIKLWIKANNLNQLISTEEVGQVALSVRKFNEQENMLVNIVVSEAEYSMKYAVAKLKNDSLN